MTNKKSKYELFLELLHKKGIVDGIKLGINFVNVPGFVPNELHESILKKSIMDTVIHEIKNDKESKRAFDSAASELIFEKLFEYIGTKKDENFQPTEEQKLTNDIAQLILTAMIHKN